MTSDTEVTGRGVLSIRRWTAVLLLGLLVAAITSPLQADDSLEDLEARRTDVQSQAAQSASELDLLLAEDAEVAAALAELDAWIAAVEADIDATEQAIASAEEQARVASAEATRLGDELEAMDDLLAERAVEAYVHPGDSAAESVLEAEDLNAAARRRFLIGITQDDITSLLDSIRAARSDRSNQLNIAEEARAAASDERNALSQRLSELEEARSVQERLRVELSERIEDYRNQTAQLQATDDQLTELIRVAQQPPPAVTPDPVQSEPDTIDLPDPTPTPTSTAEPTPEPTASPTGGDGALQWPLAGTVVSGFGMRVHPIFGDSRMHTGIDIDGSTGDPIAAAAAGTVIFAGWQEGYGNVVIVDHGEDLSTVYAHMSALGASVGDALASGETVGQVGSTGYSTGPHLHFEVRVDGTAVDPMLYLP